MPTHGSKRMHDGEEQIFHRTYGWMGTGEFYDLVPEDESSFEDSPDLEPDYISRQSGESFEHYKHRVRDLNDYSEDD